MKKSISNLEIRFWSNNLNPTDVSKVFVRLNPGFSVRVADRGRPHETSGPWDKLSETNDQNKILIMSNHYVQLINYES